MGESIKHPKDIHIKCGGKGITENYDMITCDTCGEILSSEKDVMTENDLIREPWLYLWFWLKRTLRKKR